MEWKEARDRTLEMWSELRSDLGEGEPPVDQPVELLSRINAVTDLCEKAGQDAAGVHPKCRYCLAYQQFGGCREVSGEMSLAVAERDWDRLRGLLDRFVAHLEQLDTAPAEPVSSP